MPGEWPTMTLRDAGVHLLDCEHRTPEARPEGWPYIAIPQIADGRLDLATARRISDADYREWTRRTNPQAHDVIVVRRCNSGDTAYVPVGVEFALGQNLVLLRSDGSRVVPEFLRWLTRGPGWWEQVRKFMNVGAVFDSLKCADVPKFELVIPPVDVQTAIVRLLGALDAKIELNRRTSETLEMMVRALFRSWFVDFDPVRAKADRRSPVGMDSATAKLFPDALDDSELGEIPRGWCVGRLADIAELNSWTLAASDAVESVHYVEISDVVRGRVLGMTRYPRGQEPSRARRRLRHGDTVISTVRPERASYFLCLHPAPDLVASTGFAVLTPSKLPWGFVHAAATRAEVFEELGRLADGGAYPAVRGDVVASQRVVVPETAAAVAFHDVVAPQLERMAANERETGELSNIRDALLPKLLSGELRVRDAERAVEKVA